MHEKNLYHARLRDRSSRRASGSRIDDTLREMRRRCEAEEIQNELYVKLLPSYASARLWTPRAELGAGLARPGPGPARRSGSLTSLATFSAVDATVARKPTQRHRTGPPEVVQASRLTLFTVCTVQYYEFALFFPPFLFFLSHLSCFLPCGRKCVRFCVSLEGFFILRADDMYGEC